MRVVALADSDSYLKWAAALLSRMPDADATVLVVATPEAPSARQRAIALAGTRFADADVVPPHDLDARLVAEAPDVVLVAARGPVARVLLRAADRLPARPVLVSGICGIAIPARAKGLRYRRGADLFLVHAHRERDDFEALAARLGLRQRFALATLPFLARGRAGVAGAPGGAGAPGEGVLGGAGAPGDGVTGGAGSAAAGPDGDLVFAVQSLVPATRADRLVVARMLRDAALADPSRRVVVKVRAESGERQTHPEADPYPDLIDGLGARPANLVVSAEPMAAALDRAAGLVTVSSTAAIEAVARGIPAIALDTFGVSDALINTVFADSGLLGSAADAVARRFRHPRSGWAERHYLHDPADDDAASTVAELAAARARGEWVPAVLPEPVGGAVRRAWERRLAFGVFDRTPSGAVAAVVGGPARLAVRGVRGMRAVVASSRHRGAF